MAAAAVAKGSGGGDSTATATDERAHGLLEALDSVGGQLVTLVASGSASDAWNIAQLRKELGGLRVSLKAAIVEATPGYAMEDLEESGGKQVGNDGETATALAGIKEMQGAGKEESDDDNTKKEDDDDVPFMADMFTADIDITDEFSYTYGSVGCGGEGLEPIALKLRGVAREFGQTVAVGGTGLTIWRGAEELNRYLWQHAEKLQQQEVVERTAVAAGGGATSMCRNGPVGGIGSLFHRGQCVLELGAGLGLVGLLVAALGFAAANIITDGDEETLCRLCENLRRNDMNEVGMWEGHENAAVDGGANGIGDLIGNKTTVAGQAGPRQGEESMAFVDPRRFTRGTETGAGGIGGGMAGVGRCNRRDATVARLRWGDEGDLQKVAALARRQRWQYLKEQRQRRAAAADEVQDDALQDKEQECQEEAGSSLRVFDLILAADVVYEDEAIEPLVATACRLLRRRSSSVWVLSFARRNVPVEGVVAEATRNGLFCRPAQEFACRTSGESVFELRWADLLARS